MVHHHDTTVGVVRLNGVAYAMLPMAPTPSKRQAALEARRRRNRESMRRSRQREKHVNALEELVVALEEQLHDLKAAKHLDGGYNDDGTIRAINSASQQAISISRRRKIMQSVKFIDCANQLRQENVWLTDQIRKYAVVSSRLRELVRIELLSAAHDANPLCDNSSAHFLMSLHQLLDPSDIFGLVKESYSFIVRYAAIADARHPHAQTVLGWSDKRILDGTWATFLLSKTFHHEETYRLAMSTWEASKSLNSFKVVQPWVQQLRILQVLNKETMVVCRESIFPEDGSIMRTYYLLFLATTPTGYIVGHRSLNLRETSAGGERQCFLDQDHGKRVFNPLFAFIFSRVTAVNPVTGELVETGCKVEIGGRTGNGTVEYARNVLMDVLPSTLRWENEFVCPIIRLTLS